MAGKAYKKGGKVSVAFGNKDVIKEAKKRRDGGEVGKVLGRATGGRLDRKSGGNVPLVSGNPKVASEAKSTGGKSPFSSAGGGSADKSPFFK